MYQDMIMRGGKMAIRPIYISTNILENPFIKKDIEFTWVKGMSYSQNSTY